MPAERPPGELPRPLSLEALEVGDAPARPRKPATNGAITQLADERAIVEALQTMPPSAFKNRLQLAYRLVAQSDQRLLDLSRDLADSTDPRRVAYLVGELERVTGQPKQKHVGMDAADLLALDLPELRWILPDVVPEGTTVLAAPPKVGKSCLIYQVAVEVAVGGQLFSRRVEPGSVLYLALEDGRRRGQQRLRAALGGRTMPRGRLEVRWSAPKIGEGLEEELMAWLDSHDDGRLVAIDTLQRVRARSNGKRNAYEVDVDDLGRLQELFRDRPVALVIVHHANKAGSDDFLASVSGTYGITGSADTTIVIKRKRLEALGHIIVTGRDVAEVELPVKFHDMLWQEAPQAIAEASFERSEVFRLIEESGPIFPAAIAKVLDLSRTSVQNMVGKLVAEGVVTRTTKGYRVAELDDSLISVTDDSSDSDMGKESSESSGIRTHTRAREACATCGSAPIGHYADGSPRYGCGPHPPVGDAA